MSVAHLCIQPRQGYLDSIPSFTAVAIHLLRALLVGGRRFDVLQGKFTGRGDRYVPVGVIIADEVDDLAHDGG